MDEYEYDDFLPSQDEDVEEHDQPTSPVRLLISLNPTPSFLLIGSLQKESYRNDGGTKSIQSNVVYNL